MSFVLCLRADGTLFEEVTNAMCVDWLTALHPTSPPVPGVWSQVPSDLLPGGAAVCYFNASVFMERIVAPSFATSGVNPRFDIGQVVKLDADGFGAGAQLQHGDLGTILSRGEINEFNHIAYSIKWHRADIISSMVEERLQFDARASDHDTRPLITPRMREQNRQEWGRLWNLNKTEECPVCHEKPDVWDAPMNSDVPTRCTHWVCVPCWARIAERDKRCPVCREDLSAWIRRHETHAMPDDSGDRLSDVSENAEESDHPDEDASDEGSEADDDLHCVLCRSLDGNTRNFFNMRPAGRWAGLAPGARIVCSSCYREDMGEIDSFF